MKYYRGYLVAGIFAVLSWLLMQLGQRLSQLIDMVYPYVTRTMQTFLAEWSSGTDVLIWQVLAVVLIAVALVTVVLMVLQGFTQGGPDNAAHVGGLAAGFVLAALLQIR